jgi:hypothetical protein
MKRVLFFALLLMSCNIDVIDFSRVSDNIDQSKKNGVFLYSLKVDKPVINLMDNQQSSIKQAFVECQWITSQAQIRLAQNPSCISAPDGRAEEFEGRDGGD